MRPRRGGRRKSTRDEANRKRHTMKNYTLAVNLTLSFKAAIEQVKPGELHNSREEISASWDCKDRSLTLALIRKKRAWFFLVNLRLSLKGKGRCRCVNKRHYAS